MILEFGIRTFWRTKKAIGTAEFAVLAQEAEEAARAAEAAVLRVALAVDSDALDAKTKAWDTWTLARTASIKAFNLVDAIKQHKNNEERN